MFIHVNQQQSVVGDTAQKLRYVHNIKTGSVNWKYFIIHADLMFYVALHDLELKQKIYENIKSPNFELDTVSTEVNSIIVEIQKVGSFS